MAFSSVLSRKCGDFLEVHSAFDIFKKIPEAIMREIRKSLEYFGSVCILPARNQISPLLAIVIATPIGIVLMQNPGVYPDINLFSLYDEASGAFKKITSNSFNELLCIIDN